MKLRSLLLLGNLVLMALSFLGCSRSHPNEFQGYIEGEYVYVAAPVGGTLTNLAVARGDQVQAGQLLFGLEHAAESAAVQQAEHELAQAQAQADDLTKGMRPSELASVSAQLDHARAELALSEAELTRREDLAVKKVVSKEELDQARAQRNADQAQVAQFTAELTTGQLGAREDAQTAARAMVAAKREALKVALWSLNQKQQYAPATGPVQDTLYRQGEYVPAGSPVVVLLPPDHVKVRFFVPETVLARVRVGGSVTVGFDGAAHPINGTVTYISTQAEYSPPVIYNRENRESLVYMIEAKFAATDVPGLHPGQPVDVTLAP